MLTYAGIEGFASRLNIVASNDIGPCLSLSLASARFLSRSLSLLLSLAHSLSLARSLSLSLSLYRALSLARSLSLSVFVSGVCVSVGLYVCQ